MTKRHITAALIAASLLLTSCGLSALPEYTLDASVEVTGRQGVCSEGNYYWVSGSKTLAKYDRDWNLIEINEDPFEGYEIEVNHIGDIDVYDGNLYVGAELFVEGVGTNIQVAVYDAETLKFKEAFPFEPASGQLECSGITVDPDSKTVFMCSWVGGDSGIYLYAYDLETGEYKGKFEMDNPPRLIQGIAYHNGYIYISCDDGDADLGAPDHMYRTKIGWWEFFNMKDGIGVCEVQRIKAFDDVIKQGEIEGLTFDAQTGDLLVLYNRGAIIVDGIKTGLYEGYDREISEVFVYNAA
jgi:hypothetical protein